MKKIMFLAGALFFGGVSGMDFQADGGNRGELTLSEAMNLPLKEVEDRFIYIIDNSSDDIQDAALSAYSLLDCNSSLMSDQGFMQTFVDLFNEIRQPFVTSPIHQSSNERIQDGDTSAYMLDINDNIGHTSDPDFTQGTITDLFGGTCLSLTTPMIPRSSGGIPPLFQGDPGFTQGAGLVNNTGVELTLSDVVSTSLEEVEDRLRNIALHGRDKYIKEAALFAYTRLDSNANLMNDPIFMQEVTDLLNKARAPRVSHPSPDDREASAIFQKFVDNTEIMQEIRSLVNNEYQANPSAFGGIPPSEDQVRRIAYQVTKKTLKDHREKKKAEKPSETVEKKQFPKNTELLEEALTQFIGFEEDTFRWKLFFNGRTPLADKNSPTPRELMARFLKENPCEGEILDFSAAKEKIPPIGAVELILSHIEKDAPNNESFRLFVTRLDSYAEEYKQRLLGEFSDALAQAGQDRVRPDIALFGAMYKTFLFIYRQ
ncbi:MAG: hypothetical protein LBJ96_01605 [Holosporaceae bacterium]|jgi:hypothetical protein|nr:hypothetical protein [Holosporaceae bacterium]